MSIVAIQETKLNAHSDFPSCAGFNVIRKDRERGNGGGLDFIQYNTVRYRVTIDQAMSTSKYLICTSPPVIYYPTAHQPNIGAIHHDDNRLVLGDITPHNDLWHSSLSNDRMGMELTEQIYDSIFHTINDKSPSRTCIYPCQQLA